MRSGVGIDASKTEEEGERSETVKNERIRIEWLRFSFSSFYAKLCKNTVSSSFLFFHICRYIQFYHSRLVPLDLSLYMYIFM